jgi:hypothetical protein
MYICSTFPILQNHHWYAKEAQNGVLPKNEVENAKHERKT